MGNYDKRRCQYCWDRKPQTSMTRVPQDQNERDKWICLLGKDFGANISGKENVFVCRCHFKEDSVIGRRSKKVLPEFDLMGSGPLGIEQVVEDVVEDAGSDDDSAEEDCSDDSFGAETDCSDYDSECEDEEEEEGNSDEEDVDDVIEYALVDFGILLEVLQYCRNCGGSSVEVHVEKASGYAVNVGLNCLQCKKAWNWCSSPLLRNTKEFTVNRDMTSASVSCGASFAKMSSIFNSLNIPHLRKSAHYTIVRDHVRPVIQELHDELQKEVIGKVVESAKGNNNEINVAGDAQFDSPGHTAVHARYAILDVRTNLVLDTQLVSKSSRSESSKSLEPKSLEKSLINLKKNLTSCDPTSAVKIKSITTDRDASVGKLLTEKFPEISQKFDGWHYVRNLKKLIWKKQNQKQMLPVKNWIRPLTNHLYHCFETSGGDGEAATEKFLSYFLHVQNIHKNFKNVNGYQFKKIHHCDHGVLTNTRNDWISLRDKKHKKAWEWLWEMTTNPRRLKDLYKISPYFNTAEVESYNALTSIYHQKDYFFHENMRMRVNLTVIHWNSDKLEWLRGDRKVLGKKSYYNKASREVVWKDRKSAGTHAFRKEIVMRTRTSDASSSANTEEAGISQENGDDEMSSGGTMRCVADDEMSSESSDEEMC